MNKNLSEITEEHLAEWDERFRPIDFCNSGANKMDYVEQTRDELKSNLRSLSDKIIQGVVDEVEKMKETLPAILWKDEHEENLIKQVKNSVLTDLINKLKERV